MLDHVAKEYGLAPPLANLLSDDPYKDLTTRVLTGEYVGQATVDGVKTGHTESAVDLARLAGILPAFMIDPSAGGEAQTVSTGDLAEWQDPRHLAIASRARTS